MEGGGPRRCREAGPVGADALDVAQEPGELDGKGNPEVGVDGPETMYDGHGLPDEAGASRSYEWKDAEEARKLFRNWRAWMQAMRRQSGELLEAKPRVARMMVEHLEGLLAN